MKTVRFIGYLFHRYYSQPPSASSPYFKTICSMSLLVFMHLIQVLILFKKTDLIPINSSDDKLTKRIIIFFLLVPIYFLITKTFKKSDIKPLKEKYDYNWDKVFSGKVWLLVYIFLSMTSIGILAFWKKG